MNVKCVIDKSPTKNFNLNWEDVCSNEGLYRVESIDRLVNVRFLTVCGNYKHYTTLYIDPDLGNIQKANNSSWENKKFIRVENEKLTLEVQS